MTNYKTTPMKSAWNANQESILTLEIRPATLSRPGKLGADFTISLTV
ncbi:MAG: hypothetical protein JWL77_3326 [Chthonomonadaceae bacterium]|nr:hypothetical protein [Chthonomonadaceae bacterium]